MDVVITLTDGTAIRWKGIDEAVVDEAVEKIVDHFGEPDTVSPECRYFWPTPVVQEVTGPEDLK